MSSKTSPRGTPPVAWWVPPAAAAKAAVAPAVEATFTPSAGEAPAVDSTDLLRGQAMLLIRHEGALYRLQTTRQGKLILTK